jgi:AraC-like DNA-binding protein
MGMNEPSHRAPASTSLAGTSGIDTPRLNYLTFDSPAGPWKLWTWTPAPDLAHAVASLWATEAATSEFRERIVPRETVELMVNLAGPQFVRSLDGSESVFRRAWVSGLQQSCLDIRSPSPPRLIAASLHASCAAALLGVSGREITSQVIELDEILSGEIELLADRLDSLAHPQRQFLVFEEFLRGRLRRARLMAEPMDWAVRKTFSTGGRITTSELSRRTGYSSRYVELAFSQHVGLAPKRLSRLVRFSRAVGAIPQDRRPDWARIAADCGFFDQAHFSKEFRLFAGVPPSSYAALRDSSNQAIILD